QSFARTEAVQTRDETKAGQGKECYEASNPEIEGQLHVKVVRVVGSCIRRKLDERVKVKNSFLKSACSNPGEGKILDGIASTFPDLQAEGQCVGRSHPAGYFPEKIDVPPPEKHAGYPKY